jgi:hypothetical protein
LLFRNIALCFSACGFLAAAATDKPVPTFSKDVAPIMQQNCQACHRPGEAAPFSLLTYKEARPWASSIKEAVTLKKMPPWFADPHFGKFSNDRSMAQKDIDTIVAWVNAGAPEGDPKDLPKAVNFVNGWNIGKPDMTVAMPAKFDIPAKGTIDYQYVLVPLNLTEDKWIQGAEVRPGNRALVHHVIAFVRPKGSKWMKDAQPGVPYVPKKGEEESGENEFLVGYAPGVPAQLLPDGQGKLIKAGSDIILQLHYTANGKAGTDQSTIGLVYASKPVTQRVFTIAAQNNKFVIPAGDPNYEVKSTFEFGADTKVTSLLPHMHLRGKDFLFKAVYPTGESQVLLSVPHYDFSWQLNYNPAQDLIMPKGSKIECVAHYDNSANNPSNPDATKEVRYGDQSWEEMMFGFFDVVIPADKDLRSILPPRKPAPPRSTALD